MAQQGGQSNGGGGRGGGELQRRGPEEKICPGKWGSRSVRKWSFNGLPSPRQICHLRRLSSSPRAFHLLITSFQPAPSVPCLTPIISPDPWLEAPQAPRPIFQRKQPRPERGRRPEPRSTGSRWRAQATHQGVWPSQPCLSPNLPPHPHWTDPPGPRVGNPPLSLPYNHLKQSREGRKDSLSFSSIYTTLLFHKYNHISLIQSFFFLLFKLILIALSFDLPPLTSS